MGKRIDKIKEEEKVDVAETIKGFISEDKPEKTQEQEILEFKEKKKAIRARNLTVEEEKRIKEKEAEEEEKLRRVKQELLQSLKVRIPEIEKKFAITLDDSKNKKFAEKEKIKIKETGGKQEQREEKKQEQTQEKEQEERG
ncbi:MAG: hypothetical protein HFJ48_02120 [Clostridia bacterium]|nr:hypothetical protein [Clostridia bacterium]